MNNLNKKGYIYKVTNNVNDKVFIGYNSSIPLNMVISRDKYFIKAGISRNKPLHIDMRDIGFSNFKYQIIIEIDCTNGREELYKWYRIALREYDSIANGYNNKAGRPFKKRRKEKAMIETTE